MVESLPLAWAAVGAASMRRLKPGDITIDPGTGGLYQIIAAEDQSNRVRALSLDGDGYHPDLSRLQVLTRPVLH